MTATKRFISDVYSFAFLCCSIAAFPQSIVWEKSYGGKHAEHLFDAQPTPDYGFILAGSSLSKKTGNKKDENSGSLDYFVWKMDEHGEEEWQKSYGGGGSDLLQSVRLTKDGGFLLAGTSSSGKGFSKKEDGFGLEDYWIIKLDAAGGEQWQRTIGGVGQDRITAAIQTSDGGYLIGGSSSSPANSSEQGSTSGQIRKRESCRGNLDYWIIKLDRKGKEEWQRTLGGKYADVLESFEQTRDGGYILGGYSNSPALLDSGKLSDKEKDGLGLGDFWIVKLDENGQTQWQQTLGGEKDDHLYSIQQTLDGNYLAAGSSNSSSISGGSGAKDTDFAIIKIDAVGTVLWSKSYDFGKTDLLISVSENKDGTLLLGGYSKSHAAKGIGKKSKDGIGDYIALKITAEGEALWDKSVGSSGEDILKRVVETRDGGYLMAGTSVPGPSKAGLASKGNSRDRNSAIGGKDFWVVKLLDRSKTKKQKVAIEAFPNPAQQFTNVLVGYDYHNGTASVYDLGGRLLQQFAIDGSRTIPVNLGSYPEGIYIIQVKTDIQTDSVKVIKGIDKN